MASFSGLSDEIHIYPDAHLLSVALEIRQKIYANILTDIHGEARNWERISESSYDGLRLACKQLYNETCEHVFAFQAKKQSFGAITTLSVNRTNVHKFRSLFLEVGLNFDNGLYFDLGRFLNQFELSLQELHLIFTGRDELGEETGVKRCANRQLHAQSLLRPLKVNGQGIEKKLKIIRRINDLRNLSVLHISNLNFAVPARALLINKDQLRALKVTCDARSKLIDLMVIARRRPDLFRSILTQSAKLPSLEALSLDANAIQPVEHLTNEIVAADLRQLSWRVPSMGYHNELDTAAGPTKNFLVTTSSLIRMLPRLPLLESLRLCINIRDNDVNPDHWCGDRHIPADALQEYLPQCHVLKHFEIHALGIEALYTHNLMTFLPHNVARLYLTDDTTSISQLVRMVEERYFGVRDVDEFCGFGVAALADEMYDSHPDYSQAAVKGQEIIENLVLAPYMTCLAPNQWSCEYLTAEEMSTLETSQGKRIVVERSMEADNEYTSMYGSMIGEGMSREDCIPLNEGKLGFVTYEYDYGTTSEADHLDLLRLNAKLLDREYNLHLARDGLEGTSPKVKTFTDIEPEETGTWAEKEVIALGLHDLAWKAPEYKRMQQVIEEQEGCFDQGEDWYFGRELEAEAVFRDEAVAKRKELPKKPVLLDVEVEHSTRCRWMSPDHVVPPVGALPLPKLPRNWKDDL